MSAFLTREDVRGAGRYHCAMSRFLDNDMIVQLTGKVRYSAQRRELARRHIYFVESANGEPLVEAADIAGHRPAPINSAPTLSADTRIIMEGVVARERAGATGIVYAITEHDDNSPVKLGYCGRGEGIARRLIALQIGNHRQLRVARSFAGDMEMEKMAHAIFAHERIGGEWFRRSARIHALLQCSARRLSECLLAALNVAEPPSE